MDTKTAWLAGIFEGEGWFGVKTRKKGRGTIRGTIQTSIHMTDLDVLEKVHKYAGCGRINGPYANGKPGGNWKPRYSFFVSGQKAYELMKRIRPWMCSRRSAKIDKLLQEYEEWKPPQTHRLVHSVTGEVVEFHSICKWAREHNCSEANVHRVLCGKRRTVNGWRVP